MADVPNREELIRKVVGLCNRIPGSTQWNAAEWMYDELSALLSERERRTAQGVTDEQVRAALDAFNRAVNDPIMLKCERCDGRGYHHGFGENGHDPDWCTECGGGQYVVAPGEEGRAMRIALEAASLSTSAGGGE